MSSEMTHRELWRNIMHYRTDSFDRMPVIHWDTWEETIVRWETEGLPKGMTRPQLEKYFGGEVMWEYVSVANNLFPDFEEDIIEETDEYVIKRAKDGVVMKDWKHKGCIPHFMDFTLKTAADWPKYKERLQPCDARIHDDMDERLEQAEQTGLPIAMHTGSMMGWIRNWMGVENMCYLMFDDPACYGDMVDTISDLICWCIDQTIPRMKSTPDLGFGWEDICGKNGPLVSPDIFEKHVAQGYRKVRSKLEQYGVTIYGLDSDGLVEPLIPNWMDAGVNLMFPLEPGTWKASPEAIRKKFGKELLIQGGLDKLVLEKGRDAIDAEIQRHIPLMKEGGFVMMPDHIITPGVPLDDYKYYIDRIRSLRF